MGKNERDETTDVIDISELSLKCLPLLSMSSTEMYNKEMAEKYIKPLSLFLHIANHYYHNGDLKTYKYPLMVPRGKKESLVYPFFVGITDEVYDKLSHILEMYEKLVKYKSSDSPTGKIGSDPSLKRFDDLHHHKPKMLSLPKFTSLEDVSAWIFRKLRKLEVKSATLLIEDKIDGLAAKAIYKVAENGRFCTLEHLVLRGDGSKGADVIKHLLEQEERGSVIKGLPMSFEPLPFVNDRSHRDSWTCDYVTDKILPPDYLEVNVELYVEDVVFGDTTNRTKNYTTKRSMTSGMVNAREFKKLSSQVLSVTSCRSNLEGEYFKTQTEALEWLRLICKFKTVTPAIAKISKLEDMSLVFDAVEAISNRRKDLPYDIDGAVIKFNTNEHRAKLGVGASYPNWAVAYKYQSAVGVSTLESIEWNVGRTGNVVPVVIYSPVEISGVTYTRALLHNHSMFSEMNLREGDTLTIQRSGDVIPTIVDVIHNPEGQRIQVPKKCPVCKTPLYLYSKTYMERGDTAESRKMLEKFKTEVGLDKLNVLSHNGTSDRHAVCPNGHCPAMLASLYEYVTSKKVFDMKKLRSSCKGVVIPLIKKGLFRRPEDLFNLTAKTLSKCTGHPLEQMQAVVDDIDRIAKSLTLTKMLVGLSIPNVSESFITKFLSSYEGFLLPDVVPARGTKLTGGTMMVFEMYLRTEDVIDSIRYFKDSDKFPLIK